MTGDTNPSAMNDSATRLLSFWFEELAPKDWFIQRDAVDQALAETFGHLVEPAGAGALGHWMDKPETALALILVLDQLPRNLNRGSADAFRHDPKALAVSRAFIERYRDAFESLPPEQKLFVLLPLEHAEDLAAQDESVRWFEYFAPQMIGDAGEFWDEVTEYARRHHEPIRRFGRFPHRNEVLGRETTPDEAAWLEEHPSGF